MSQRGDEITTKFKVDISDLKKGITEANQNIKLANAQFKAASAGMDDWSKSSDGINAKLKQLTSVLDNQKAKLENYTSQQKKLDEASAENGKRADELRKKMEQLASQGVSKTSNEYKAYQKALTEVEKEQEANEKASEKLKVTILNQQAAVNKTQKEIDNYRNALDKIETESNQTAAATDKLTKEISDQQAMLYNLKQSYQDVVLEQGKHSDEAKELASAIDKLSGELKENKSKLDDASDAADKLDKSLGEANKNSSSISAMKVALASLAAEGFRKAIEAAKEFVVETIKIGKEFDASMSKVAAISGATGDELEKLRDKAKEMGASTIFTASEAAEAFNYMAMAGWKTEDMLNSIEGVMSLAAASGEELGDVSDIVTDAMTAFGMSADGTSKVLKNGLEVEVSNCTRFVDVLAAASNSSNTNVSMLGESFKYVAPVAGSLSYSIEDVAVALGLMANQGIKSSMAGTSLRTLLTNLAKPTKQSENAMIALGISLEDNEGNMKSLMEVMQDLRAGFGSGSMDAEEFSKAMSELDTQLQNAEISEGDYEEAVNDLCIAMYGAEGAEKAKYAAMLAGTRGMAGLLAIVNTTDEDFQSLTNSINNASGTAEEMADTMRDNLGGDMTQLGSKLEGVQLSIYEKFEPALRSGVAVLSKFLDGINFIVDHSTEFIAVLTGMSAAVATYLTYTTAIKIMEEGWKSLTIVKQAAAAAQWALNAAQNASPVGIIITLIGGLVAAFVVLWNKSEGFRNFWIGLWEGIKNIISICVNWVKENWQALILFLINPIAGLFKYFYDNFDWFRDFVDNFCQNIKDFFANLWAGIQNIWSVVANWFNDNVVQPIKNFFQPLVDFFTEIFNVIKEIAEGCWIAIQLIWSIVSSWFDQHIIQPVKKFFTDLWNTIKNAASTAWDSIKKVWSVVSSWFDQTIIQPVKKVFTGLWDGLKDGASKAWDGIKSVFSKVKDFFQEKFSQAWAAVKNIFSTGGKIFDGIKDGIVSAFKNVVNGIIGGINKVVSVPFNAINSALDKIRSIEIAGIQPFSGLISRITVPQIPLLATGGILKKGQIGLLEGSGDEAVVPLERNKYWIRKVADELKVQLFGMQQGIAAEAAAAGVSANTYNFYQTNNSPAALSRREIYRQTKNLLALRSV